MNLPEKIRELRRQVPLSIPAAKGLIEGSGDLAEAIDKARMIHASPVMEAVGASLGEALEALEEARGDAAKAVELLEWRKNFNGMEKARRPTVAQTRRSLRSCDDIYELLEAAGVEGMGHCPPEASGPINHLHAIYTFHSCYIGSSYLLFEEYESDQPRIVAALRAMALDERADLFEAECRAGECSAAAYADYLRKETSIFRKIRSYAVTNAPAVHEWVYRESP